MDYVWTFLAPFVKDKTVWMTAAGWLLALINAKTKLGLNQDMLNTAASAVSTFAVVHLSHLKTFGGDGKQPPLDAGIDQKQ